MEFCFLSEELLEQYYSDSLYELLSKTIVDVQNAKIRNLSYLSDFEIRLLYDLRESFKHSSLHDE